MKFEYNRAINYSGYRNEQSPLQRLFPAKSEILEDLKILENQYYYLRLFDCSEHAYTVLELIESNKLNFKVMLGLSLAAESNYENHPYFHVYTKKDLDDHKRNNIDKNFQSHRTIHNYTELADTNKKLSAVEMSNQIKKLTRKKSGKTDYH